MPKPNGNDHSAAASLLGYLYQCRIALLLFIQRIRIEPSTSISIEKFDDIAFHVGQEEPLNLIQTKHHVNAKGNLTDASIDLWRTIKVWIDQYQSGTITLESNIFSILTTATAPEGSAANFLRENSRHSVAAEEALLNASKTSRSMDNKTAYEAFRNLTDEERRQLVSRIHVVDCSPQINNIDTRIKGELVTNVRSDFIDSYLERLEGWWLKECVRHLSSSNQTPIPGKLLVDHMVDISEQYHPDNLPIDEILCDPPTDAEASSDQREFVKELRRIACNNTTIKLAIQDFYRAFEQRGRWVRDELLLDRELERYEGRLVEEWKRFHNRIVESMPHVASEDDKSAAGRTVFHWSQDATIYLRPRCTEPFVVRGSFHMLANDGRVGWHPEFVERVWQTLASAGGR